MAMRCCSSFGIIAPNGQAKKMMERRVFMAHKSQMQPDKVSGCLFKLPLRIKVFEDKAKGILCYRDEKGELVCEGYDDDDEGPRSNRQPLDITCHLKGYAELQQTSDALTQKWLQILGDHN